MRLTDEPTEPASGAPPNLREVGRLRVLRALHETERASRPELVRMTGLARATVTALVAELTDLGLVQEYDGPDPLEARRTGRPAHWLSLVPSAGYAVGADIGHQHVGVALCDLSGTPVWHHAETREVDHAPEETLSLIASFVDRSLRETGVDRERVLGIGAGIASPVDRVSGTLRAESIMPGWSGVRPAVELSRRTGMTTQMINDANAGALAERLYGAGRGTDNMVYIRLSAGIGAGIVSDGRLLLGAGGLVGEIGHLPSVSNGLICRCGNRGCLETVASPPAVAQLLANSWAKPVAPSDLPQLLANADTGTRRAVEDAGLAVGHALASLVTLFNPELIVVGGDLTVAGELILEPIRQGIRQDALPAAAKQVTVVLGALGDRAEVRGAAGIVLTQAPRSLVG
jgi:predicted NBD/HSP70 family sugar kinase